jgi:TolA-binding protein
VKKALSLLFAVAFLSACGSEPEEPVTSEPAQNAETESVSDRVTRMRSQAGEVAEAPEQPLGDPERELPRLQGQFTEEGMGLANLVDGTSPQAFAESLQRIASETSQEQYRELDSSLRYLRMYSSAAWSGLPGLYESLDNMTGEEIIAHARRLQAERRGGN